jgi:hypothetical protein
MPRNSRRHLLSLGVSLTGIVLIGACASVSPPTPTPLRSSPGIAASQSGPTLPAAAVTAVLPNSDLAVGSNRFLLGLLDAQNRPIVDAQVHLRFFYLADAQPTVRAENGATFHGQGLGDRGLYVAPVSFEKAGQWGVEVAAKRESGDLPTTRWSFHVLPESQTPAIGAPAISSRNQTLKEVSSSRELCTAVPACDMHDHVIEDVVRKGRPLVVYFATPGFCVSLVCGPGLEAVQAMKDRFGDRADFIHIEIFKDPAKSIVSPVVEEWRLPSEPWLFLVDRQGKIAAKFEAGITIQEVEPAIARLVG